MLYLMPSVFFLITSLISCSALYTAVCSQIAKHTVYKWGCSQRRFFGDLSGFARFWVPICPQNMIRHAHTHTHVYFCEKWGHPIGVMVFILYKLYVLLPYYTNPTPKLSPHRRLCISTSPQKTHSVWFIRVLKSGTWGNVLISTHTCVIIQIMSSFVTKRCAHTHTHTHTHTHMLCFHVLWDIS